MLHCKSFWNGPTFSFLIAVARNVPLELKIKCFGGYLILHYFHSFSSGNSPLNLDILIPLVSFPKIFSALSKYVLHFNAASFDIEEMRVFVQSSTFSFYSL